MYYIEQTGKFRKDIKLAKKRGLDMRLLDEVVTHLVEKVTIPQNTSLTNFPECIRDFGSVTSNQIGYYFGNRMIRYFS